MANISLTKENIKYLRDAFSHFFPEDTIYSADKPYISGEFNWENRRSFVDFVYRLTEVQIKSEKDFDNIKKAQLAVEELVETGNKKEEANTQTKEQREEAEKIRQERDISQKKAVEEADAAVKLAVKKQQEIYSEQIQKAKTAEAALKNQKIYYKVEKVPVEETPEIKNLKQQAKADPKKFIADATNQFNSSPNLKDLSVDEARVISRQAAITTYDTLTDNSPLVQIAIINKITSNPELLNKLVPNPDNQKILKDFASDLIEQKKAQFELTKRFIDFSKIDGHKSPDSVNVEFSFVPKEGFGEFDINQQILSPSIENLNQQNLLLDNLKGFGEGEIKSQILLGIGNRLESYVAKLPADSLLAKTYNSEIVQLGLTSLGVVEAAPWIAVEGSVLGKIVVGSGFGQVAGFLQAKTGINLGIKLAAKVGTETAVKAGTTAVVKTGFKAAFSKVTAALGSAGGPIGTVLAWLGGELLVKIAEKIPWDKVKKWSAAIIGGVAGLIALPFLGLGAAIGIGAGAAVISAGLGAGLGGATLGGVVGGIAGFFGALGGAFLGAIGMPILITFLAFPVVVAIIMFIINSGAYIVPPTLQTVLSSNPYIQVDKVANPAGPFKNTDLPLQTSYTVTVTAKKGVLTNITFKNDCQILTSGTVKKCPSEVPTDIPASISPSSPYTFTYSEKYSGNDYKDSIVLDTFTVIADAQDASKQEVSGSASVSIGTPPTACLTINQNKWPSQYYANIVSARSLLVSKYSSYISKVCLSYTSLELKYNPIGFAGYWGWNHGSYIDFFPLGVKNQADTLYTLSHELGHSLAWGDKTARFYQIYLEFPGITTESPFCFYGATQNWNADESMPESIALYVIQPRCGNVQQKWPIHYQFLMRYVFN